MRIGIDLCIQGGAEPTGVERAQATLLDALLAVDEGPDAHEYVLLSPERVPERWRGHPRVQLVEQSRGPFWMWRETVVPSALRRHPVDVFHSPVTALPMRLRCPLLATVHEVPWAGGDDGQGDRSSAHRLRLHLAAELAARVLCVSERTAADFVQLHPDAAHRVCVVPHGVDPRFSATGPPADLPWDLGPDCILAVGRLRSKKNLATLLDAFALRLAARGDGADSATAGSTSDPPVEQLVLAGPDGDAREALELRAARPDLAGRVRFLGFVSDDLLPQLYRHARCLVFPSLFEGFGLPVLEAMACGRPVLVSEQGAVAEAVGGAAHAVDGRDPGRLAKGLAAVLDDADHRQQLVAAGREHAASRSAACAAAEMLKVYEQFR